MSTESATITDRLWSEALDRILPATRERQLRPGMGDHIDLFVLQSATHRLLGMNPGFARVLYTAAYESAERNAYFVIRRLGMPADFFWRFDHWSEKRALEILRRVFDRIFAALIERHSAGRLTVESVDIDRGRIELSFRDCAECRGATVVRPACFFHSGTFAGLLGSMLNRKMTSLEVSCSAAGDSDTCRFLICEETDRAVSARILESLDGEEPAFTSALRPQAKNETFSPIDIGYYQLLLGTAFLPNLDVLELSCIDAGRAIGHEIAEELGKEHQADSVDAVRRYFSDLRYMELDFQRAGRSLLVRAANAPESLGVLRDAAIVPVFCGELESILNDLGGESVRFDGMDRDGDDLLIRFVPDA